MGDDGSAFGKSRSGVGHGGSGVGKSGSAFPNGGGADGKGRWGVHDGGAAFLNGGSAVGEGRPGVADGETDFRATSTSAATKFGKIKKHGQLSPSALELFQMNYA